MKNRWEPVFVGRAYLVLVLIAATAAGQNQPTSLPTQSGAFPYRWIALVGFPLAPQGYTEFISGSMGRRLSEPIFFRNSGLGQSIRIGLWATTYFPATTSGQIDYNKRSFYAIGFVMLDSDYALVKDLSMELPGRVSLVGGLGAGPSIWGLGFLASAGLRLEIAQLMGEVRLNINAAEPSPSLTLNVGYQTKTVVGASLLPVAGLIALLISAALLASALGLF